MILMMKRRSSQDHELVRLYAERSDEAVNAVEIKGISSPRRLQREFLQFGFQPGEWDVICHSGKDPKYHVGNQRFKVLIQNYLSSYLKAESRILKSAVITDIITVIRSKSTQNGGFVRYDEKAKLWYEVGDKVARDKVGHSLREAMRNVEEPSEATILTEPSSAAAATPAESPLIIPDKMAQVLSSSGNTTAITNADSIIPVQTTTQSNSSSGSSNMETVSGGAQSSSDKEELTPVAMNLADWFEADITSMMDET